ncbi:probable pectinesterase 53 [Triticum aestivum]|uniref:probable pectinesterase 53 n=1 Tax=Triticum aestivum TaxID=4565 RepID=UPI001D02AA66|nr:probable pectinesterase 53 [Triticum aestivum]
MFTRQLVNRDPPEWCRVSPLHSTPRKIPSCSLLARDRAFELLKSPSPAFSPAPHTKPRHAAPAPRSSSSHHRAGIVSYWPCVASARARCRPCSWAAHPLRLRLLLCIATVAAVASGVDGHTRGVRPRRVAGRPFTENATRAEELERMFMRWVRCVGGLKHSTFQHAPLARAFPSYSLVVDKDPAAGGFTSVQAAVDSLPTINLVPVVIKVNAGTYTEKMTISSMRAFITLEGAGADKTIV